MKAASVNDIKKALKELTLLELTDICLRLARAKKENKELLTYLLFEAQDVEAYTESIKMEMDEEFKKLPINNVYFIKKGLRKILRNTNKVIRYTGLKTTEAELLIHFCKRFKDLHIMHKSPALSNLYNAQIKKLQKVVSSFHEDLQYDYKKQLEQLAHII